MYRKISITLFILLAILSLQIGVENFSLLRLLQGSSKDWNLMLISRLPRLLAIIITASILSINGKIIQTMANNKFVSPSTIGTMDWCKLGILFVLFFLPSSPTLIKILVATLFGVLGSVLFMLIINMLKVKDQLFVPLIGLMLGAIIGSISTFFAYKFDLLQNIASWLQGDFALVAKGNYELLYLGVPLLIIDYLYANVFTITGLGSKTSTTLGINYNQIITIGMLLIATTTSIVVVTIGTIPFVGLIVPNIISYLKGDNLKTTMLDTMILGSIFLLVCDLLGRIIYMPYEIPVNIIVGVVGSVIFIWLLLRGKKYV